MASFAQMTVIVLAGLAGPLLSASRKIMIPVVVGELLAGIALGKTGAGIIKADDPTIAFLGNIGFAMLMLGRRNARPAAQPRAARIAAARHVADRCQRRARGRRRHR